MFKLIASPLAWWPVIFAGVAEDGTVVENKIEMRFSILAEDEFAEFIAASRRIDALVVDAEALASAALQDGFIRRIVDRIGAAVGADKAHDTPPRIFKAAVLAEIVSDWRGVGAENGEALRYSLEHFAQLLNVPNVAEAVLTAYRACRAGRAEGRAGN
ncbi:hypothetical protein BH10PSE13_BH10PSE13_23640 [soil metagenome]